MKKKAKAKMWAIMSPTEILPYIETTEKAVIGRFIFTEFHACNQVLRKHKWLRLKKIGWKAIEVEVREI